MNRMQTGRLRQFAGNAFNDAETSVQTNAVRASVTGHLDEPFLEKDKPLKVSDG